MPKMQNDLLQNDLVFIDKNYPTTIFYLLTKAHLVFVDNQNWKATGKQFVNNNTKGRILKRLFQENKARQIFRKTSVRVHIRE